MKFKSLFLSAGLFFTTTGYSFAEGSDSIRVAWEQRRHARQNSR